MKPTMMTAHMVMSEGIFGVRRERTDRPGIRITTFAN